MNLFTKALVVAVVVSCHLSLASATMIDEIGAVSLDTVYGGSDKYGGTGVFSIEQDRIVLLVEMSDNTQKAFAGVHFLLETFLQNDRSTPAGQAIADFARGTITLTDSSGILLNADIGTFSIEEALNAPEYKLVGSGNFNVTGGTFDGQFGPNGVIFDITWEMPSNIDNFTSSFEAESDVTLTPEPVTMVLLVSGAFFAIKRRRRHNC